MHVATEPVLHSVFYGQHGWMVRLRTTEVGPYMTQEFAIKIAVAEGIHLKKSGQPVSIMIRDEIGKIVAQYAL